jgi:hypothetical protein
VKVDFIKRHCRLTRNRRNPREKVYGVWGGLRV